MRILTARYTRKFNLGNYENEEISMEASIDSEDYIQEFGALKLAVLELRGVEVKRVCECKEEKKDEPKKQEAPKKEESKQEEKPKDEPAPEGDKPEPEKPVKKKRVPRKKKPKHVLYSRESKEHKENLASILDELYPNWRKESKDKAAALSKEMHEVTPIFDENGEITADFREKIIQGME